MPSGKVLFRLFVVALLIGVVFLAVGYINTRNELNKTKNPEETAKQEAKDLVNKVSGFLVLPEKEQPTVATVKDRNKLQDAALKNAVKNGDKILVYAKAQVIVVYRPSAGKVVLFQPLNLTSEADTKKSSSSSSSTSTDTTSSSTPSPTELTAPAGSDTTTSTDTAQ